MKFYCELFFLSLVENTQEFGEIVFGVDTRSSDSGAAGICHRYARLFLLLRGCRTDGNFVRLADNAGDRAFRALASDGIVKSGSDYRNENLLSRISAPKIMFAPG